MRTRQRCGDDVGSGHNAVSVAVVLVNAHAVKSQSIGMFQFVQVIVVVLSAQLRVEVFVGQVYPGASVLGLEVRWQVLVGHQVEH